MVLSQESAAPSDRPSPVIPNTILLIAFLPIAFAALGPSFEATFITPLPSPAVKVSVSNSPPAVAAALKNNLFADCDGSSSNSLVNLLPNADEPIKANPPGPRNAAPTDGKAPITSPTSASAPATILPSPNSSRKSLSRSFIIGAAKSFKPSATASTPAAGPYIPLIASIAVIKAFFSSGVSSFASSINILAAQYVKFFGVSATPFKKLPTP